MEWPFWTSLRQRAFNNGGRIAFIEQATGQTISYGGLVDAIHGVADRPRLDILRVGNRIEFVVRFLAAIAQSRNVLPVDPTAPPVEVYRLETLAGEVIAGGHVLLASSGTTGAPKLVRRHRDCLTAVARGMAGAIGLLPTDQVLAAVPLSHSYGMEHGLLAPLWAGCTVRLCDGLDVLPVAAAWRAGATVFPAVPSMLELLLRSELPASDTLRRVYTAGAPLPPGVADAFERRYGVPVGQVYGTSEIGSVTYRDPARDAPGSVGRAVDGVWLRIDAHGELHVHSPATDRYFPTGDLAHINADGEVTLLGRTKLLIDVGGAKVNPLEVEATLAEHPGVAGCVVMPLVLSETIRKVRAVVVPADPLTPPSAAELRQFVRNRLARHKVPRLIEFRDTLPRTAAGKIVRHLPETA